MNKVFIIAEIGVNHNGDCNIAKQLIDVAVEAGADAVKFQTFNAGNLVTVNAKKANYQKLATDKNESQYDMLRKIQLSHSDHFELLEYCNKLKIEFISTAFDMPSFYFLVNDLRLKKIKISSSEITNAPLLLSHAESKVKLILSTGMSTMKEIKDALSVISFGLIGVQESPSMSAFNKAYESLEGQKLLKEYVTLLHCTSEYPASLEDINLKAMLTIKNTFNLEVGYSDHSLGITVSIAAAAMGASVIEKHITLKNTLPGPDHSSSLEPSELIEMVSEIRAVEKIIGSDVKEPCSSEISNRDVVRKSLVASKQINKGDVFSESNLTMKRPGTEKSPFEYWDMLGKVSDGNYNIDEFVN